MPGNRRPQVQTGRQPGGGDPQDRQLGVPAAGQRIGQVIGQGETVSLLALDLVVRGGRAQQDLDQEQGHHQPEILGGGAHRRGHHHVGDRILGRRHQRLFLAVVDRVVPGQQADAGNHEQDAEHRPHEAAGGGRVADQGLVREVVGVRLHVARTIGGRGPGCPEEEPGHQPAMFRIGNRVFAQGVGLAQVGGRRVVGEHAHVMRGHLRNRQRALVGNDQRSAFRIVGIEAHLRLDFSLQLGFLAVVQALVGHAEFVAGAQAQQRHHFAMQPVGRPVGGDQGAMAPDRAVLLAADALPHMAPGLDVLLGVEHLAAAGHHLFRHGRRGLVDVLAQPQHDPEADYQQGSQAQP